MPHCLAPLEVRQKMMEHMPGCDYVAAAGNSEFLRLSAMEELEVDVYDDAVVQGQDLALVAFEEDEVRSKASSQGERASDNLDEVISEFYKLFPSRPSSALVAHDLPSSSNNNDNNNNNNNNNNATRADALLFDPNSDEVDDLWVQENLKHTSSPGVLSCPGCFTVLSYHFRIAALSSALATNRYVSTKVLNCRVDKTAVEQVPACSNQAVPSSQNTSKTRCYRVFCAVCGHRVGAYEKDSPKPTYRLYDLLLSESERVAL